MTFVAIGALRVSYMYYFSEVDQLYIASRPYLKDLKRRTSKMYCQCHIIITSVILVRGNTEHRPGSD